MNRSLSMIFAALVVLVVGCGESSAGGPMPHGPCISSDDCGEPTTECRPLDLEADQDPVHWCVELCDHDCGSGQVLGECLGVDAEGRPDPSSSERHCFLYCEEDGHCVAGTRCADLEYDGETIRRCVPE
ncbi:MAG: hypothetical protein ACOC97_06350, partial [Myxococcota bacterium]